MAHVLIVGGTGMLRDLCLHFSKSGNIVTVIARNQKRLEALKKEADAFSGTIIPLALDYCNSLELSEKINKTIRDCGPIDTAVCWVHTSTAPDALRIIGETINKNNNQCKCRLFLLLSSATADPSREKKDFSGLLTELNKISLRTILLGFVIEQNHSRWLTEDEICSGLIEAIVSDKLTTIIGTIEPWEKRP